MKTNATQKHSQYLNNPFSTMLSSPSIQVIHHWLTMLFWGDLGLSDVIKQASIVLRVLYFLFHFTVIKMLIVGYLVDEVETESTLRTRVPSPVARWHHCRSGHLGVMIRTALPCRDELIPGLVRGSPRQRNSNPPVFLLESCWIERSSVLFHVVMKSDNWRFIIIFSYL